MKPLSILPSQKVSSEICCQTAEVVSVTAEVETPRGAWAPLVILRQENYDFSLCSLHSVADQPPVMFIWVVMTCHRKLLLPCAHPICKRLGPLVLKLWPGSTGIFAARINYRLRHLLCAQACLHIKECKGEAVSCSADRASISREAQLNAHCYPQ